jgi:cobalt-zinc-cadmium efflux system membrane fusion protein
VGAAAVRAATVRAVAVCAVAGALLLVGWGCKTANSTENKAAPAAAHSDPLEVTAGPDLLAMVKVGEPAWENVRSTLLLPGRIEVDESRVARAGTPVTGRIVEMNVIEGQSVKRGQTLAVVHSTELTNAQLGFLKAHAQQQVAGRAVDRAKQLLDAGVIGSAELQRREAELSQTVMETATVRDQLAVLGMSPAAIARLESSRTVDSTSHVVSAIDGIVMERKAAPGQVVQPSDPVFVVADLTHVWVVAEVPEHSLGSIAAGKPVEVEIGALPGARLHGKLSFVGATVHPETRTVRARMDLPNPKLLYKPAMLANMLIQDRVERKLVVPATAVVREGNQENVFVAKGGNVFAMRAVTLAEEAGDKRVLAAGLKPGEKIALDGAFHLNTERKRASLEEQH